MHLLFTLLKTIPLNKTEGIQYMSGTLLGPGTTAKSVSDTVLSVLPALAPPPSTPHEAATGRSDDRRAQINPGLRELVNRRAGVHPGSVLSATPPNIADLAFSFF